MSRIYAQESDILEELQDPAFLTALAQLRQRKGSPGRDVQEQQIQDLEASFERRKRKRERPVLLKDIPRVMVTISLRKLCRNVALLGLE